jgi:hypothetical protein
MKPLMTRDGPAKRNPEGLKSVDALQLDCETPDSTIRSLSSLTGVSAEEIRRRLSTWSWRAFERFAQRRGIGGHEVARAELWRQVFDPILPPVPRVVCWFHATRVLPSTDFAEGLLPLPAAVPRLIGSLERIGLRRAPNIGSSFHAHAHDEKMSHRSSWGSFGHLVRDAAFSPMQNHFFRAPEAVVDLGFDVERFRLATVPCIVKFQATEAREDVAELALYYSYLAAWRQPAHWDCSTTWSGWRSGPAEGHSED